MTAAMRHGTLSVRAGRLCDAEGTPVTLRGMSLFWSQWGARYYTAAAIDRLVDDWRIDVVRAALAVEPDGYLAEPETQLARIGTVVEAAIARSIYVLVDWHGHAARTADAVAAFAELARRYGHHPNLLWEPWNEPAAGAVWTRDIVPHHLAVIDALRGAGAHGVVVCGTPRHCQDLDAARVAPLARPDVAYALHFYAGSHGAALRAAAARAIDAGLCLFTSEYGLGEADGDGQLAIDEIARWWRFLETHGISHVNWSLFDKAETCAALRRTNWLGRWVLSPSGRMVRDMLRAVAKEDASTSKGGRT